ncbi:hypothetical protein OUL81_000527 [Salmonella enterica]|nr:hypothetical protein [Salmonella enterica]
MSNIDKQALRETAVLADRLKIDRLKICGSTVLALLDELEKAQRQIVNFQQSCENDPRIHEIIDLKERIAELDKRLIEYAGIATREARRVAELEARTVNLPAARADDEYFIDGVFQALRYERDIERAIIAAGIKVKE